MSVQAASCQNATLELRRSLARRFKNVRQRTLELCEPLEPEDCVIQSMPDASPVRWHLAHSTWFFETFALAKSIQGYRPFHPEYERLFNSYYESIGKPLPQAERGLLSRPTVADVLRFRAHVDRRIEELFETVPSGELTELGRIIEIGVNHEEQHQELILTDIKHALSVHPLKPTCWPKQVEPPVYEPELAFVDFAEELCSIGHSGGSFSFDNESPEHRSYLHAYSLGSRLVTNREYAAFIEDGGYSRPELWLAEGFHHAESCEWKAPLYWTRENGAWMQFTLHGQRPIAMSEPVCHVSLYEADAFARWSGARLPTEVEWEAAAKTVPVEGNFLESEEFHPTRAPDTGTGSQLTQMFGDVWEWTSSAYSPYPGYRSLDGPLGEYNGKFMVNQYVLRGGSCAVSREHIRPTYRNFFHADARWQFSGIRLAKD